MSKCNFYLETEGVGFRQAHLGYKHNSYLRIKKKFIAYIDICRRPNHEDRFAGKCRRDCVVLHLGAETDASHYHHPKNHSRCYFFSILQSMSWKS
jgi:hypothetical protein